MGGGGHAEAAGYTVYGTREDVINQLIGSVAALDKSLDKPDRRP